LATSPTFEVEETPGVMLLERFMRPIRHVGTTLFAGLALAAGVPAVAHALPFAIGDVFASTGNGTVTVFDPVTGAVKQVLSTGLNEFYTTGGMFDAAGNFYVTTFNGNHIAKWDNNGNLVSATFMTGCNSDCESITRGTGGIAFVGQADGTRDILAYDIATGTFITSFDPTTGPRGTDWVDLAADQKTIYYTSEGGTIRRFDISTNTQLSDFNAIAAGDEMYALRILADGGVLVAATDNVLRYNAAGVLVQTYTFAHSGTLFGLNLDPDGTTFWTGDLGGDNKVFRINIATGAVINSFATNPPNGQLAGLAIFGEITQGGGGTVPEPASVVLMLTGLSSLAGVAGIRRRKGTQVS
jgi:WD40 repeat protein